jgi:hypothetical protein
MNLLLTAVHLFNPITMIRRIRAGYYWAFENQLSFIRWLVFHKFFRILKFDVNYETTSGVEYSKKAFSEYRPLSRIYFPIFALESVPTKLQEERKLLVIGPRYENEIFISRGLGLKSRQIFCIDSFSYSSLISLGDMHKMKFGSQFFSEVLCSWTLSYSSVPDIAAEEITRVTKIGGKIVISIEKVTEIEMDRGVKGVLKGEERIQTQKQLVRLFPDCEVKLCIEPKTSGMLICVLERIK